VQEATNQRFNWAGLPLVATVARLLCRELTLQNEYLRLENKVLKSKVKGRIRFDDHERRSLVDAALAMGRKLMRQMVTIVKPQTILRWQRRLAREKWDYSARRCRPGRSKKPVQVEELVCRMASGNTWGYRRIQGELATVGVAISKSCVADILRRNGLPPSPERRGRTWREFLSRHADVMLCADLFTQEVWTSCRFRRAFVLFVIHVRTPFHAPNANAYAERWVRSIREECLSHLVLFGLNSLRRVLREYRRFFNQDRPHQGIGNRVPATLDDQSREKATDDHPIGRVRCDQYIGGLLESYRRAA